MPPVCLYKVVPSDVFIFWASEDKVRWRAGVGYPLEPFDVSLFSQTHTQKLYRLLALRDCSFCSFPVGLTVSWERKVGPQRIPELLWGSPGQLRATATLLRLWVWGRQPHLVNLCDYVYSELMASAGA